MPEEDVVYLHNSQNTTDIAVQYEEEATTKATPIARIEVCSTTLIQASTNIL